MPRPVVSVTVNPAIVTQLLPDTMNPFVPPLTVTAAPGAGWNTIGAPDVPELATVTPPPYVPEDTTTVWPASATEPAFTIEQNGCDAVPPPESEQFDAPLSTYNVETAPTAGPANNTPTSAATTMSTDTIAPQRIRLAAIYPPRVVWAESRPQQSNSSPKIRLRRTASSRSDSAMTRRTCCGMTGPAPPCSAVASEL